MSLALALFAASSGALGLPPQIELPDRSIRAGDLAHVPGREQVVLGTMPKGKTSVTVDAEAALALLRKHLPFAELSLRYAESIVLLAPPTSRLARACYEARNDIAMGAPVTADDVSAISCSEESVTGALGYDRDRKTPVARGGIAAGAYLGAVRPLAGDVVGRGTRLTFRTGAGPVMIEREVEALQAGRTGGRIFARTRDGEVIAAPVLDSPETAE